MESGGPKLRIKRGVHTSLDNRVNDIDNRLGIVWSRFSNQ
jgi:hypothetical protein